MIKELAKVWEKRRFAEFVVLFRHLHGGNDKNYGKPDKKGASERDMSLTTAERNQEGLVLEATCSIRK
jgi:hypothetical protein